VIILREGGRKVDIVEIDLKRRRESNIVNGLILQGQADRDQPTCVVAIDATRTCSSVEVRVDQSDSRKRNEIYPVIETKMVAAHARQGNLKEIPHRAELHHGTDRKIRIRIVIQVQPQSEHCVIYRSCRQTQVAPETPAVLVGCSR